MAFGALAVEEPVYVGLSADCAAYLAAREFDTGGLADNLGYTRSDWESRCLPEQQPVDWSDLAIAYADDDEDEDDEDEDDEDEDDEEFEDDEEDEDWDDETDEAFEDEEEFEDEDD
jgi:hypothetical protein